MTSASIDAKDTVAAGLPKTLFPAGVISTNNMYAVTRDGQRFLVDARLRNTPTVTPLTVTVNWTSTLQK